MTRNQHNPVSHSAAALVAARIVSAGLAAITWLVLINNLPRAGYGAYALATGLVGIVVVIADIGLTSSAARFVAEGRAGRTILRQVVGARFVLALIGGAALAGFGWMVSSGIISGREGDEYLGKLLALGGLLVVARSFVSFSMGMLPAQQRIRRLVMLTVGIPATELVLVATVIGNGGSTIAAMTAIIVVATLGGAFGIVSVMRSSDGGAEVAFAEVRSYSLTLFIVWLCFAAFTQVDQLVIWMFRGTEDVAPYAAAWQIITLLHLPALAVATVVAPRLARDPHPARTLRYWTGLLAAAYLVVIALAIALAPAAYDALMPDYSDSAWVVQALAGYALLLGIAPLVTMSANYLGGAQGRVRISLFTIVLNLLLDLALVPTYGIGGAAFATTIAFGWYTIAHLRLADQLARDKGDQPVRSSHRSGYSMLAAATFAVASLLTIIGTGAYAVAAVAMSYVVPERWAITLGLGVAAIVTAGLLYAVHRMMQGLLGPEWTVPAYWNGSLRRASTTDETGELPAGDASPATSTNDQDGRDDEDVDSPDEQGAA